MLRSLIVVLLVVAIATPAGAADWAWLAAGESTDLVTTWWAIHEGASEAHPLLRNHWAALAAKSGYVVLAAWGCQKLRDDGHPELARWLAVGVFIFGMLCSAWNMLQARRAQALH